MTLPSHNIELKARCADLDAVREAVRGLGAVFAVHLQQVDTYFHVTHGRLKLRETAGQEAQLVGYERADVAEARGSDYCVVPVAAAGLMMKTLAATLGVRVRVAKHRELWMWQGVRIHLDRVEGLGTFVEFEAVMQPGEPDDSGHARLRVLRDALKISDGDVESRSYADLVEDAEEPRMNTDLHR